MGGSSVVSENVSWRVLKVRGTAAHAPHDASSRRPLPTSCRSSQTRFQKWSLDKGASQALDGIGMLVNQAALSYKIWNRFSPDTERVEQLIRSL